MAVRMSSRREEFLDFLPIGEIYKPFPGAEPVELNGDPVVKALTEAGYLRVAFAERMVCREGGCSVPGHYNFAIGLVDPHGRTTFAVLANGAGGPDAVAARVVCHNGKSPIIDSVASAVANVAGLYAMDRLIARSGN